MDGCPETLAPFRVGTFSQESFQRWWQRVGDRFSTVPKNVGRQWLWRHWGRSEFQWLPTRGANFELELWQPQDVARLQIWKERGSYADWGDFLLSQGKHAKGYRFGLAWIMQQRRRWPAPPIVLDHDGRFQSVHGIPSGPMLIEGNRRVAMAKALARVGELGTDLPVWVLRY